MAELGVCTSKDCRLPVQLQRAMAAEAEAAREARAKVILMLLMMIILVMVMMMNKMMMMAKVVLISFWWFLQILLIFRLQVIAADGEQKAARALKVPKFCLKKTLNYPSMMQEASDVIAISPAALQLRYLQVGHKNISHPWSQFLIFLIFHKKYFSFMVTISHIYHIS